MGKSYKNADTNPSFLSPYGGCYMIPYKSLSKFHMKFPLDWPRLVKPASQVPVALGSQGHVFEALTLYWPAWCPGPAPTLAVLEFVQEFVYIYI